MAAHAILMSSIAHPSMYVGITKVLRTINQNMTRTWRAAWDIARNHNRSWSSETV